MQTAEKKISVRKKNNLFLYKNTYINQKWISQLEPDDSYPNGKKLSIKGKDLKPLDQTLFKIDLLLTKLELSPDHQSCLVYKLENLPSGIGNLVHLRELKLDSNDLSHLPAEIGHLVNLERLSLSNNSLDHLPDSFVNLTNLKSVHLSSNLFEKIPNCIFQMSSLVYLDLTSNKLKCLDKNLIRLRDTLRFLSVYDNCLGELESWLGELVNLEQFWFGLNQIKMVPLEITRIKKLDWSSAYYSIILEGNPIHVPPVRVCRKGFSAMQKWYLDKLNRKLD